jgi:hypothetical protein
MNLWLGKTYDNYNNHIPNNATTKTPMATNSNRPRGSEWLRQVYILPQLVVPIDSYDKLTVELNKLKKDTTKDLVVIDSITAAIDQLQVKCEMIYKGFDIWKNYNDGIQALCTNLKSLDKTVIITGLEEIVPIQGLDGSMTTRRRLYVQGKEWANKGIESECLAVWSVYANK